MGKERKTTNLIRDLTKIINDQKLKLHKAFGENEKQIIDKRIFETKLFDLNEKIIAQNYELEHVITLLS